MTTTTTSLHEKYLTALTAGASIADIKAACLLSLAKGEVQDDLDDADARVILGLAPRGASTTESKVRDKSKKKTPRLALKKYSLPAFDVGEARKELVQTAIKEKWSMEKSMMESMKLGEKAASSSRCSLTIGVGEAGWVQIDRTGTWPGSLTPDEMRSIIALAKAGVLDSFMQEAEPYFKK